VIRKVIQISASRYGEERDALYALCDDGTIWEKQWRGSVPWISLSPIPQQGHCYWEDDDIA
jgi:hypothetical protein